MAIERKLTKIVIVFKDGSVKQVEAKAVKHLRFKKMRNWKNVAGRPTATWFDCYVQWVEPDLGDSDSETGT